MKELFQYRLLVEPATAARAARRRTSEDIRELDDLCDAAERELRGGKPEVDLPHLDAEFHLRVAAIADSAVITEYLAPCIERMLPYHGYRQVGAGVAAWHEHRAVCDAIRAGDRVDAARAMSTHLVNAVARITAQYGGTDTNRRRE